VKGIPAMRRTTPVICALAMVLALALAGCATATTSPPATGTSGTDGVPATGRPTAYYFSTEG
jgi:hypothetical protein